MAEKIWLDDERESPDRSWCHLTNVHAVIAALLGGDVKEMSLDHDLGAGEPTGYDLLYCMARLNLHVPIIHVHSANPVGAEAMQAIIDRMELAR